MTSTKPHIQSYPVFLDLTEHRVLVAGGGSTAMRKVKRLIDSGADIRIVAPSLDDELRSLCQQHQIDYLARSLEFSDFENTALLFAASNDQSENLHYASLARKARCFVNVANTPASSSFLVPSLVNRAPVLIAISSTGVSPILARLLSARIEAFLPQTYSDLGKLAERYRERINRHISNWRHRRRFWEGLLNGRVGELILQGQIQGADDAMQVALQNYNHDESKGEVYLVGAGPGDPDLLTFRALRLMQQCDVVLYDRLVSDSIMALVSKSAQRIYVGKQRSDHAVPQKSINAQLAQLAKDGNRVLRLKGGDPFMFGRGGEEIETLAAEGVDFQIVPGITAATGCSSYAGIPLTHRDHAQVCLFVTGHLKDGSVNLDWQALSRPRQTVVIYMGLLGLPLICQQLIDHGMSAEHPIALIAKGTRENQHVVTGTLGSLPAKVVDADIKPPTLIIIGEVVALRNKLAWFEARR